MPGIAPIHHAWMYDKGVAPAGGDISTRLAPPYDIVTDRLRNDLLEADPTSSAAIDVPQLPVDQVGPDAAYARARRTFESWVQQRIIRPLDQPVFGLLRQSFADGRSIVRRHGVLANVPVAPLGRGAGLYAHEHTGCGLRGDRLALVKAMAIQTSPVFGLYSDDEGTVEEFIRSRIIRSEPRLVGVSPDGTLSELWLVEEASERQALTVAFGSRDVIIADGHHRYASQEAYLQSLGPEAPAAARSCMMALVAQEDAGMGLRAVHHVFAGMESFSIQTLEEEAGGLFRFEEVSGGPVELHEHVARAWFERSIPMGLIDFQQQRCFVVSAIEVDPLAATVPEAPEAWRRAGPVVCQRLIVERCLRDRCNSGRDPQRRAVFNVAEMSDPNALLPGAQLGIILLPVRLADVLVIATSGFLLPPDSTFFWPKLPTGLLFKSLE